MTHLLDCGGVLVTFSLPLAGSTLMVTLFGLGVLVFLESPVSGMIGTMATVFGGSSMYALEAVVTGMLVRTVVVLVIDWSPPCIGQAELRTALAGLLTPGISL
jgi:hypothetical protein